MNWESGVFCKLYKTNKYKFNPPKYLNLTDSTKSSLRKVIENQLNELGFNEPNLFGFNLNIKVNEKQNCCLYNLSSDNKNYYFSYLINFNFYQYYNLISYGRKLIKPSNDIEKENIPKWEKYLCHLLFLKELNQNLLLKEITTHLNSYFKLHNFILVQASYFDIILLSIIIDLEIFNEILKVNDNKQNFQYFKRWILSMTKIYEIDPERIKTFYKNKETYFLYNTYKLTSCPELANAVKELNYSKTEDLLLNFHENVETRAQDQNKTTTYYKTFKSLAHIACFKKDKKMLSILIKYGVNLESKDYENMTPIYDAIYTNDVNFVDYLIKDLKVNLYHKEIQNRTPFYWACCSCSTEMIKYLMTYPNIDINSLSAMGRSSLSKACWNGNIEVVKLLCEHPSINTINTPDCNQRCPLHNAVWGEFGGREGKKVPNGLPSDSPECAEILINKGAKLNPKDSEGNTPLMIAASTNGIRSMKVLMKYNIDLNEENNNHETALIQAIKYGNYESVLTLIEYYKNHLNDKTNVDLDKPDNIGITPIYYAIIYGKILCLKPLIENMDNYGYNNENKIKELINISIESKSKLCFQFLIRRYFKTYSPKDSDLFNILKRLLIYEQFSFFNFLYDIIGENKIIDLINISGKEILLFLLIIETLIYKNYSPQTEQNNNNVKKLSEDDKEKLYEEILNKKMSTLTESEIDLIENQENTLEDKKEFLDKFNNIIIKICSAESQSNELNINLMKYLIFHNREKEFLCLKPIYSRKNIKCIEYKEIAFDKNDYILYIPEKHKLIKDKLFSNDESKDNKIYPDTISYLNETNLLFIIIEKANNVYFKELIDIKYLLNYYFDIIKSSRKNILHILFDNFNINKFNKIIEILEEIIKIENNNNIIKDKFIPLFSQNDSELMTPLDIIINRQDENSLKIVMNSINDLCKKFLNENNNNSLLEKSFKYAISKFKINTTQFELDSSYIQKISSECLKCKKFIQNNNVYKYNNNSKDKKDNKKLTTSNFEEIYSQSKYFVNEECINNSKIIIDLILNNHIEDEFKIINQKYIHEYIDSEEKLIEISKEISKEKVLGIDAEFDGEKCEIDGVVATIQISTFKKSYVVDSLKLHNLIKKYLGSIFEDENILKVFHGCNNDLAWILSNFEIKTINIYDTSESFVVFQELILNKSFKNANHPSLYYLVVFFLGVKLNKIYQTSNWKIRPLTDAMYQYALNDAKSVLYLYYIMQGLYAYLNKINFREEDKYKEYYYNLKKLFFKDREDVSLADNEYPEGYYKNILVKIRYNCLEMMLNKLKSKNIKINIELDGINK